MPPTAREEGRVRIGKTSGSRALVRVRPKGTLTYGGKGLGKRHAEVVDGSRRQPQTATHGAHLFGLRLENRQTDSAHKNCKMR